MSLGLDLQTNQRAYLRSGGGITAGARGVFGYYFLATPIRDVQEAAFALDIADMAVMGLDAYALAFGAWNSTYQDRLAAFADAFVSSKSQRHFFLSLEVGGGMTAANVISAFNAYKDHPNYLWLDGRPVLVTSRGQLGVDESTGTDSDGQTFWSTVFASIDPYFAPAFWPNAKTPGGQTNSSNFTLAELTADYKSWYDTYLDAMLNQSITGTPEALAIQGEAYATLMAGKGKGYFAGVQAHYARTERQDHGNNDIIGWNGKGGAGQTIQWDSIINVQQPRFVMAYTRGDLGETAAVLASPADMTMDDLAIYAPLLDHAGLARIDAYHAERFKKFGQRPAIAADAIVPNYITHRQNVTISGNTQIVTKFDFDDQTRITVFAIGAGTVEFRSGGTLMQTITVPGRGIHEFGPFPNNIGVQNFRFIRGGNTLINANGDAIVSNPSYFNFSPYAGYLT